MFIRIPDLWRYLGCKKKYKDFVSTPRNTHLRVIDVIDGSVCQRPRHSPVQFCSQGYGDNLRGFRGRQDLPREVFTQGVQAAAHAHSVTICQKLEPLIRNGVIHPDSAEVTFVYFINPRNVIVFL